MKTDDLIRALAADAPLRDPGLRRQVALAMASGLLVALALFLWLLGPRANALQSLDSLRFLLKFAITLSLAVAATGLVLRLIHPGLPLEPWRLAVFLAPGLLLLAGVGLELAVLPASDWSAALVGRNARTCLTYIPLMGLAPLGLLLLALRRGAPGHPALAGGVAGLVAGGFSAALYAAHCPDDSPLFVVTWYSIGITVLVALGALIGRRVLRW